MNNYISLQTPRIQTQCQPSQFTLLANIESEYLSFKLPEINTVSVKQGGPKTSKIPRTRNEMLYTLFDPINWNVLKSSKSSLDDLHLKLLLANLADDPAQRDRVFEEYCKFLTQPIELAILKPG
ncbi:hypothetical protein HDV01_006036 [Terramyces sp. JEL0728]|nr:hypothetical protein HDV01_006036 [Terramyces sp. JEL0728]